MLKSLLKKKLTFFQKAILATLEYFLNSEIEIFPTTYCVGLLNSALEHDSSSLLNFLFRDPLGETAVVIIIVVGPLGPD